MIAYVIINDWNDSCERAMLRMLNVNLDDILGLLDWVLVDARRDRLVTMTWEGIETDCEKLKDVWLLK